MGGDGSYKTIQDAVNALDSSSSSEQTIFIHPGTYSEQVYIQALSGPLTIYGYTSHVRHYSANQVRTVMGKTLPNGQHRSYCPC